MAKCRHCGVMNKDQAKSCVSCGKQLAEPARKLLAYLAGIVLAFIAFIGLTFVMLTVGIPPFLAIALAGLFCIVCVVCGIACAYWSAPGKRTRRKGLLYSWVGVPMLILFQPGAVLVTSLITSLVNSLVDFLLGSDQRPKATRHNPAIARKKKANVMVCKGCGGQLEADSKLCPWCGREVC